MPGGRPSKGTNHVMQLEGALDDKHRLRVILDVIAGAMSVRQACEVLRISEARYHQLRGQVLQAALDGLAPKASGRPRAAQPEDSTRVHDLKRQVRELEMDLQAALVRTELALAMPQVLMDRVGKQAKKNSGKPPS